MVKIGVLGHGGRMGGVTASEIKNDPECTLVGSFGKEGGLCKSIEELCLLSDVIIDFSVPLATMKCLKHIGGKTLISGTTGFSDEQIAAIGDAGKFAKVLLSGNMSFGIAVAQYAIEQIVPLLQDFDIEIVEKHHNKKVDSPSGTAATIGDAISKIRGVLFDKHSTTARSGQRSQSEIGMHSIRGGTVAGEHTVHFFGNGESIEITHKAETREIFARGAIKLGKLLHAQQENGFFDMKHVIGLMLKGHFKNK